MNFFALRRVVWACVLGVSVAWLAGCATDSQVAPNPDTPSFGNFPAGAPTTWPAAPDAVTYEGWTLCKKYSGQVGPAVVFDVAIDESDDGSVEWNESITVADGECYWLWIAGGNVYDRITVTENVPPATGGTYTASYVVDSLLADKATVESAPSVTGNSVSQRIHNTLAPTGVRVTFTNTFVPTPDPGCTYTQGYWKTHSVYGPAGPADGTWDLLASGPDTPFFLSGQTWYEVFWTSPSGNAYYSLAHQYMAAKLNVLNGADPTDAASAIASAETLFGTHTPAHIGALKGSDSLRQQFLSLAGTLDDYNMGLIGPGHCEDEVLD